MTTPLITALDSMTSEAKGLKGLKPSFKEQALVRIVRNNVIGLCSSNDLASQLEAPAAGGLDG